MLYQRWIEVEPPEGVGREPALWSWPLVLADGRVIVTLLYRPLGKPGAKRVLATQIVELDAAGGAQAWGPGAGYPAPVLFYADACDVLYGLDLARPGKVYACAADGTHVATLEMTPRMGCLIAPEYFCVREREVFWRDGGGASRAAVIRDGGLSQERVVGALPEREEEVRFPHAHVTRGRLLVLDFEPMPRISVYAL